MSPAPFPRATRETTRVNWSQWDPWAGFQGLAGVALPLFIGLLTGHTAAGSIAAGGALYIGVGSYDKQSRNSIPSLLLGSALMALSALLGSLAGEQLSLVILLSALWAFGAGLLSLLGPPLSFIGIKSLVTLIIASGYPSTTEEALQRTGLILAGALTQTLLFASETHWAARWGAPQRKARPGAKWKSVWTSLRGTLSLRNLTFQHALRLALCVALAQAFCRPLFSHNAYWLPLTTAIVLRPDFEQTLVRGFSRMLGTMLGAVLTTLIVMWIAPSGLVLAFLALASAWCCFSFFQASYSLYSASITAYIVFLLSFVGLPEAPVLYNRLGATLLGGAGALLVYTLWPGEKKGK